jgi:hypothetical protein
MKPILTQKNCRTCGVATGRTVVDRFNIGPRTEEEILRWSEETGRGFNAARHGTSPRGLREILDEAGIETRAPFGRTFNGDSNRALSDTNIQRALGKTGSDGGIAPDPSILRFTLDDAGRELRDGNQVMAVVNYMRGKGESGGLHWVTVEKVGNGRIVRDGKTVIDGPYVIIGDPATGKSIAISQKDFARHWNRESTLIALSPSNSVGRRSGLLPPRTSSENSAGLPAGSFPGGRHAPGQDPFRGPSTMPDMPITRAAVQSGKVNQEQLDEIAYWADRMHWERRRYYQAHPKDLKHEVQIPNQGVRRAMNALEAEIDAAKLPRSVHNEIKRRILASRQAGTNYNGGHVNDLFHNKIKVETTTPAMRSGVRNSRVLGKPATYIDPQTNKAVTITSANRSSVQADHIYPANKIAQLKGFGRLTPDEQRIILHDSRNIIGMPQAGNGSKGDLLISEWDSALKANAKTSPYPDGLHPAYRKMLEQRQDANKIFLQQEINSLLAARGG